jgi:hypothetical protein
MERVTGIEPATFCMASRRSSQLSYTRPRCLRRGADRDYLTESEPFASAPAAGANGHARDRDISRKTVRWYSIADQTPTTVEASSEVMPIA